MNEQSKTSITTVILTLFIIGLVVAIIYMLFLDIGPGKFKNECKSFGGVYFYANMSGDCYKNICNLECNLHNAVNISYLNNVSLCVADCAYHNKLAEEDGSGVRCVC